MFTRFHKILNCSFKFLSSPYLPTPRVLLGQFPLKSSGLLIGLLSLVASLTNLALSALDISSNLTFTIGAMGEEFKMEIRMVMVESLDPENSQGRAVCAIAMILKLAAVVAVVLR